MNFKMARLIVAVSSLLILNTGESAPLQPDTSYGYDVVETTIRSRGVPIPISYTYPLSASDEVFPLVVMAHGHAGTRHEAGGFTRLAVGLASQGMASIRMDFPGCGDSIEPFTRNNLTNMIADIRASRDYAVTQPQVDQTRVALLGFSMGGRLVLMLSSENQNYQVIATWAPAGSNGAKTEYELMGGLDR